MTHFDQSPRSGRGFTIVEVIVVMSIILILIGLFLPALQAAREAARRTNCVSNMRSIGIAVNAYSDTHNLLPRGATRLGYSLFCQVLPYIDQMNLYNSLNFLQNQSISSLPGNTNWTVASTQLAVLVCPSDSKGDSGGVGTTSYAGNGGYGIQTFGRNGVFVDRSGGRVPQLRQALSFAAITDGTSSTACLSEWLTGSSASVGRNRLETVFSTEPLSSPSQFNSFVDSCRNMNNHSSISNSFRRRSWSHGLFGETIYNHVLNIDGNACTYGSDINYGSYPAASYHSSSVNVLFVDGHVNLVANTIDLAIWRGLATFGGNEIISDSQY